jgi:hypothetical protein
MELAKNGKNLFAGSLRCGFLVLAAFIAFSVLFAETLNAADLDQDYIGEMNGCPKSLKLKAVKDFFKDLKTAVIIASLSVHLLFLFQFAKKKYSEFPAYTNSPVMLKVRFNI